jgi:hypothetical protein
MDLSKAVASTAIVLAVMLAAGYAVGHQEPAPETRVAAAKN